MKQHRVANAQHVQTRRQVSCSYPSAVAQAGRAEAVGHRLTDSRRAIGRRARSHRPDRVRRGPGECWRNGSGARRQVRLRAPQSPPGRRLDLEGQRETEEGVSRRGSARRALLVCAPGRHQCSTIGRSGRLAGDAEWRRPLSRRAPGSWAVRASQDGNDDFLAVVGRRWATGAGALDRHDWAPCRRYVSAAAAVGEDAQTGRSRAPRSVPLGGLRSPERRASGLERVRRYPTRVPATSRPRRDLPGGCSAA